MQPFTQKYAIIQLLEDVAEGTEYLASNWPLHVTIVDVFAIDWDVLTMIEELTKLLGHHQGASSVATEDMLFGPEKQTRVILLEKTDSLVKLHYDVTQLLEQGGLKLNNPEFAKQGFLPHSTVQQHARLNKGDNVAFSALSIIDMFPDEDPYKRRVLKTITISGG
ncbi:MAG TPA: 2'-5' RNA ligase family protein [Patescibacteria group bacterium]|jgi:2'-5' RNA ligase|nr:2'-5' RNA ligase family protein [Patescibacteria group bacterium]